MAPIAVGPPQPCCERSARNLAPASFSPLLRGSFEAGEPLKWGHVPDSSFEWLREEEGMSGPAFSI